MSLQHVDRQLITDLNLALDEARVHGMSWEVASGEVEVLLSVLALPDDGTFDGDPRRVLALAGVDLVQILLRRDRTGALDYGPPIALDDQQGLQDFFDSLAFADAIYGGRSFDDPSPTVDWPTRLSLEVTLQAPPGPHGLYWFTECGRDEPGGVVMYLLEGWIRFGTVAMRRADGTPLDLHEFTAAADRWWTARLRGDPRASPRSQRRLAAASWHAWRS